MDVLATWPNGFSIIAELHDHSFIALSHGEDQVPSPNAVWDLSDEEDEVERRVIFADLLDRMIEAEIIDTEHISGLVIDISGYDYLLIGDIRGVFTDKHEDTGQVYIGNGGELTEVVTALNAYYPATDTDETSDDEQPSS